MSTQKKDEIRARLTIYGMRDMSKKEFVAFRKWIALVAENINTEDQLIYSNRPRFTLYK